MTAAGPAVGFAVAFIVSIAGARAQSVADVYHGKTIRILIGTSEGGGFDLSGRLIAQFIGRYIPGDPNVVPQNMPGASGLLAAEYLYNVAPKDGTVIAITQPSIVLNKAINPSAPYQPRDFGWIGRLASFVTYGVVWHTSPVQTIDKAKTRSITLAANGPSGPGAVIPGALNQFIGTKFVIVKGYKGPDDNGLAMQRGETNGIGSAGAEYLQNKGWLDQKLVRVLYTIGANRSPAFSDAPSVVEIIADPRDRDAMKLIVSPSDIGRAIIAPPGLPRDRLDALRQAFERMIRDPEFQAQSAARHLDLEPRSGDNVQKFVAEAMGMPANVVERARAAMQAE